MLLWGGYEVGAMMPFEPDEMDEVITTIRLGATTRARIDEILEFENDVRDAFRHKKRQTFKVIAQAALRMFVAQYWQDLGGRPTNDAERNRALSKAVAKIKKAKSSKLYD